MHRLLKQPISDLFSLINNLEFCRKTNPDDYLHLVIRYRQTLQDACAIMEQYYYHRVMLPRLNKVFDQAPLLEPDVHRWFLPYISICIAVAFKHMHVEESFVARS